MQLNIHLIHITRMDDLAWPLQVLSKAVHFKNLTGASQHVGLSQPQLSRLIAKLESELDLVLLDRSARRRSSWTAAAFRLAQTYEQSRRQFYHSVDHLRTAQKPKQLVMDSLEGILYRGCQIAEGLFKSTSLVRIDLDVFDLNDMEERYLNGKNDLILTSRVPGRKKPQYIAEVGWQSLETQKSDGPYRVMSHFEFGNIKGGKGTKSKHKNDKLLLSNSLAVRRSWITNFGGEGVLPSEISKKEKKGLIPVVLIGGDHLHPDIWAAILKLI